MGFSVSIPSNIAEGSERINSRVEINIQNASIVA